MATMVYKSSGLGANEKVFHELEHIEKGTRQAIRRMWFDLGVDLQNRANKEILRKPKSGRLYIFRTKSGAIRRHIASAKGETHANFSGKLRRAIGWKVYGSEEMVFGYGVGKRKDSPEYDLWVEFGTRKMRARPSLENAIEYLQAHVEGRFQEQMFREFNG